ncbi:MAG: hypothetical protein JO106_09540 [Mycobacterium sp.]|nr:hypothetical protein [Mycobacterium sp.]
MYAGTFYVKCLACNHNVYLGEPQQVATALAHLSECPGQVTDEDGASEDDGETSPDPS